jgi:hypothetical protein
VVVQTKGGSKSLCQTRIALEYDNTQGLHTASLIRPWRRLQLPSSGTRSRTKVADGLSKLPSDS